MSPAVIRRSRERLGKALGALDAAARRPMRMALDGLVESQWLPFEARARLHWRAQEYTWIAHCPETFNGKVHWRLLKDRRPILTTFADKVAVRDHVARLAGPDCLSELLAVVADARELDRAGLPREFVVKASHASGGMWIVSDAAAEDLVKPGEQYADGPPTPRSGWNWIVTSPDRLDWDVLVETCREWLSREYREQPEWAYLDVPRRILVEQLLRGPGGEIPDDYKLFVFDGVVRLVQVDSGRFDEHRRNLYLPDWTPVDAEYVHPRADRESPRPASLERMVELAETLGRGMDFVRVDLYDLDGRVVFGELTNYPEGGTGWFRPSSFDTELGRYWTPPS